VVIPCDFGTAASSVLHAAVTFPAYTLLKFFSSLFKTKMPDPAEVLPGRSEAIPTAERHRVNGQPLKGPYPLGSENADFALGCFWGAEKLFWELPGVIVTAVGYQGGATPNPTYQEACSGRTGHAESVRVVYDPKRISYEQLLRAFWEDHDPTQGYRQGNDVGTQYRSAIYTHTDEQALIAEASREMYQAELTKAGYGQITTEIRPAPEFYFAEDYHQQYLVKNPNGYCPIHATGVKLEGPIVRMERV
jgi:peptide-methionine (S)-S-oxide reductase